MYEPREACGHKGRLKWSAYYLYKERNNRTETFKQK